MFGRISRPMMTGVDKPTMRAASTYSRSFRESTWALTARSSPGQPRTPSSSASITGLSRRT